MQNAIYYHLLPMIGGHKPAREASVPSQTRIQLDQSGFSHGLMLAKTKLAHCIRCQTAHRHSPLPLKNTPKMANASARRHAFKAQPLVQRMCRPKTELASTSQPKRNVQHHPYATGHQLDSHTTHEGTRLQRSFLSR